MCGIAGIIAWTSSGKKSLSKIDTAVSKLNKRGPDDQGIFKKDRIALGHTRLSVIDTSSNAAQPFTDDTGRYTIVFNGEFYNYAEHRDQLQKKGVKFRSESDTEVLLQLFIKEGADCLDKINGFFAFAIYDQKEESLFIARDRVGIKPLYIYQDDEKLLFASEMKAIMAVDIPRTIDEVSLFTYLQLTYIPAPHSILKNVRKLMPGHFLEIKKPAGDTPPEMEEKMYYTIPFDPEKVIKPEPASYESAKKQLVDLLEKSVQRRMVSDVPLGTFLSGGIDSSVITAIASRQVDRLRTFSIGYADQPFYDETGYAEMVAKKYRTDHTVFSLSGKEMLDNLQAVLEDIDEPFADSSSIAVHMLSRYTREHITVALSGDGADELFAGYNKHEAEFRARTPGVTEHIIRLMAPVWNRFPQSRSSKFANISRQLNRFSQGIQLPHRERYWKWACFTDEEKASYLLQLSEDRPVDEQRLSDAAFEYKKRKEQLLKGIRKNGDMNDILLTDMNMVLQNDMLTKIDRMSMANSLEVRVPFLDHQLIDFAFTLPAAFKINASMRKKILQDAFRSWLPKELYNRPKQGFEVPLKEWLSGELRFMIEELLDDTFIRKQGIFNPRAITEIRQELFSGKPGESQSTVWALIVFQYWWRKYIQ